MYGFLEQLLHYFDRPHVGPPSGPVGGPAAWRGSELAGSAAWRERLDDTQIAELQRAVATARASGRPTRELTADHFPLPSLCTSIARWRDELRDGRGFVMVSGFPVSEWNEDEAAVAFWCLGHHLGVPGAQNEEGDLLGNVKDLSATARHADERLYRTNKSMRIGTIKV